MNNATGEMYVYNYFPTKVAETYLKNYENINNDILPKIYDLQNSQTDNLQRSNEGGWHSTDDLNYRPEFRNIHNAILESVNALGNNLNYDTNKYYLKISNMWSIINKKHDYNSSHSHTNALWSGVYYVKADKDSGNLNLYDPRLQAHTTHHYTNDKELHELNYTSMKFTPHTGKCLIFPGWLIHDVSPSKSDNDRIIISFNIGQSPKVL